MSRPVPQGKTAILMPSLGLRPATLGGVSGVVSARCVRLSAPRLVRFGTQAATPPNDEALVEPQRDENMQTRQPPVASAVFDAAYRRVDYHVTAWQPLGKRAFVFAIVMNDQRLVQPNVPEGADLDEVLQNAVRFVEQFLDGDASDPD